jgi:hypothetical protein
VNNPQHCEFPEELSHAEKLGNPVVVGTIVKFELPHLAINEGG